MQLNRVKIIVHLNYAKQRLDIVRFLSMSDGRIGCRKQVKRASIVLGGKQVKQANYSAWWDNVVSETVIKED